MALVGVFESRGARVELRAGATLRLGRCAISVARLRTLFDSHASSLALKPVSCASTTRL